MIGNKRIEAPLYPLPPELLGWEPFFFKRPASGKKYRPAKRRRESGRPFPFAEHLFVSCYDVGKKRRFVMGDSSLP